MDQRRGSSPSLGELILQRIDPNLPLWVAGLLIYFCGYFRFDLLLPVVIISIAYVLFHYSLIHNISSLEQLNTSNCKLPQPVPSCYLQIQALL